MRNKRIKIIFAGIIASLCLGLFSGWSSNPVMAASSESSIYKKTLLNAIKTCYSDTYMKKSILGTDYYSMGNLFTSKGGKDGTILVPTMYGNTLTDGDMACDEVFIGWKENKKSNSAKGLLTLYGKSVSEDKLPSIGYTKEEKSANGGYKQGCVSFKYTAPNGSGGSKEYETNQVCVDVDGDNKIDVYTNSPVVKESKGGNISIYVDANYTVNVYDSKSGLSAFTSHSMMAGGGESWDDFKKEFQSAASQIDGWYDQYSSTSLGYHFDKINATLGNEDHYFEYTRSSDAATKALRYFAGSGKTWDSIKFNDEDRYTLYTAYIERYIKDTNYPSVYIGADSKCSSKVADAKKDTGYAYRKDKNTWCPLYGVENGNVPQLNGIDGNNTKLKKMSFKDIVNEMMKSKYDTYAADTGTNNIGTTDPDTNTDDPDDKQEQASPCSQAGQSLGWIICPVVQLVSEATQGIYGYIESTYLQMNPDFIDDDGTRTAWGSFRTYANIIFVIILSIILLSQITGFGVSNYGIKKMLPTIIVMAILVNISFFLCEIAVDLSNIVGYGAGKLFDGIAAGSEEGTFTLGGMVQGAAMTFLTGTGMVGGLVLAYNTVEFWLIPFLLMILVAFVSVVVFFILLGVRQAGIIILVTLAPVAIICYALPNTKKVFERWWKLLLGLLLVYPICGLLMSGGQFASRLLLNVGSNAEEGMRFSYAFVAILLQAVPFFFVPSILRSSFAAMGNIGNKLSMLGSRFSRSATGAIRRSEGYKDMRGRLASHNAQRMLNREDWNNRHRILGMPGRVKNRAGARIRSGNGRLAEMANNSYDRRQARRVNAVAGQRMADQNARFVAANGLESAERRERDIAMKNYESNYRGDDAFMNDFAAQSRAYDAAIDEVDRNPADMNARAQLRALQNVLGSSADGQDIIQNVLHRRLATAQSRGDTAVSAGMVAAGQTLMGDHGGFKSGNRGLNKLSQDLASGKALASGHGSYQATAMKDANGNTLKDKAGNQIYENNHYGAAAAKGSATELAGANDSTLQGMLSSIQSGNMSASDMSAVYRNASEAITNDNITVKPENEDMLNRIRQAAYGQLQSSAAGSADYYDSQGRTFTNTGGNNYQYTDAGGAAHNFTRDAATGNFTEVGGVGEVINGSDMMTASENFTSSYGGNYRDLHASDEFKVSHEPARRKIEMPPGWMRNSAGTWINSRDGFRNLTPDEVRRAEQYEAHNIQVDIDNDSRR